MKTERERLAGRVQEEALAILDHLEGRRLSLYAGLSATMVATASMLMTMAEKGKGKTDDDPVEAYLDALRQLTLPRGDA
jgi:hypothetical protein